MPRPSRLRRPRPPVPEARGEGELPATSPPPVAPEGTWRQPDEPPFAGPLEAGLRHPVLTLAPLVLLVAAAIALGLLRSPVHTSEARVNVGQIDVPAFTLQGVVIGNQTLAAGYARTIVAEPVVQDAARRAGLGPQRVRDRLDASPIPGSTLIQVEAEGRSGAAAIRLANAGAEALIAYVAKLNTDSTSTDLLERFRRAERVVQAATARVQRLERAAVPPATLPQARLELKTARLEAQRLANRYQQVGGGPDVSTLLQLVAPAASADSDFGPTLQRLGLLALAAGLVLGLGLALLRANRGLLRRGLA